MSWGWGWKRYVPVSRRRANAAKEITRMKKRGVVAAPVILQGRSIVSTFWGKAWCDNLESYSDFANRLPRGRTYVRNGSVIDLQIAEGKVTALVSGSSIYRIEIKIQKITRPLWRRVQGECAGQIKSLIDLLQGRFSDGVMRVVTRPKEGLFPKPGEITMNCSCPDWADLCKHLAATLYGVGARLDQKPELLFQLRGVDPEDLISKVSATEAIRQTSSPETFPRLDDSELADVFGIELDNPAPPDKQRASPPTQSKVQGPKTIRRSAGSAKGSSKSKKSRGSAQARANAETQSKAGGKPRKTRKPTRNT